MKPQDLTKFLSDPAFADRQILSLYVGDAAGVVRGDTGYVPPVAPNNDYLWISFATAGAGQALRSRYEITA